MAYQGPAYGLSRECALKSAAKFSVERAQECLDWIEAVTEKKIDYSEGSALRDQQDFGNILKNGALLCELINKLRPGTVRKINTMNAPFKQRENIELYLKGCENYGLHAQDLFQVNDLFEAKKFVYDQRQSICFGRPCPT